MLTVQSKREGNKMKKYPRIKTSKNQILIVMVLDEAGAETTDWYSLKEIRQILKEQRAEEKIRVEDTENCEYDCDEKECLATGCSRYGKCAFTKDKG